MDQHAGFQVSGFVPHVCHLHKALYGLKQASRAWYERLSSFLHTLGFHTSTADSSLMIHISGFICCYILIYVDDIVIMGNSDVTVSHLISELNAKFFLKDLGKLNYFLGVEVSYPSSGGLFLSQSKYIFDLLTHTKMAKAKIISTPMISGPILSAHQGELFHDVFLYRSVVGAL